MKSLFNNRSISIATILAVGAGGACVVQAQQAGQGGKQPQVVSASVDHTKSMDRLQGAAQKLRESIQALAQQSPGPGRDAALASARDALLETQRAMIDLPADLRVKTVTLGGPSYSQAMEKLQQAAQKLRESVQAMAQQPAGDRRNEAMAQARQALLDTQQAMINMPNLASK